MNSVLSRMNGIFAFTLTVMAVVTALCYFSTVFNNRNLSDAYVKVAESKPVLLRSVETRDNIGRSDLVQLNVEINADFTKLFDWNTKELFVYAVASYETERHPVNEIVLWDKIIKRGEDPIIKDVTQAPEYYFLDNGSGLKSNNISLELVWNIVPFATGHLPLIKSQKSYFLLPSKYA